MSDSNLALAAPDLDPDVVRAFLRAVQIVCKTSEELVIDCEIVSIDGSGFYATLGAVRDRVSGLDVGADDYVVCHFRHLLQNPNGCQYLPYDWIASGV